MFPAKGETQLSEFDFIKYDGQGPKAKALTFGMKKIISIIKSSFLSGVIDSRVKKNFLHLPKSDAYLKLLHQMVL